MESEGRTGETCLRQFHVLPCPGLVLIHLRLNTINPIEKTRWKSDGFIASDYGAFWKNHKDVIQRIRESIEDDDDGFTERNFAPSEYTDSTGCSLPMYGNLPRKK